MQFILKIEKAIEGARLRYILKCHKKIQIASVWIKAFCRRRTKQLQLLHVILLTQLR